MALLFSGLVHLGFLQLRSSTTAYSDAFHYPVSKLAVTFKALPRPLPPKQEVVVAPQGAQMQNKPKTKLNPMPKAIPVVPQALQRNLTAEPSQAMQPGLDLSKILSDTQQVAKDIAERKPDSSAIVRRNLQIKPENLSAPTGQANHDVDIHTNAYGDLVYCLPGAEAKKHCLSKKPDDPNDPFTVNVYRGIQNDKPKPGEALGKQFQEAIDRRGPDKR